jgi:hypothetical protein
VQERLDLTAIRGGVACFGSHNEAAHCAVMEVAGSQESLAKVDEAKQEELLAAYAQFLNSVTFPFQIVVQVHPVDLAWYVARVEDRGRSLSSALVAIARDHAAYVQSLTRQRTLLERRIYIVIPWSGSPEERAAKPVYLALPGRHRRTSAMDDELRAETIQRQLADRCDVISRQLSRAGLRAARLDDLRLAQLYHIAWAPEVARTQRLRQELADYTALVVGAEPRSGQPDRRQSLNGSTAR